MGNTTFKNWDFNDTGNEYATDWTQVKHRWLLTMTQRESEIVMDMLGTCDDQPEVEVLTGMVVATGVDKPGADGPVYGSCEEARSRR